MRDALGQSDRDSGGFSTENDQEGTEPTVLMGIQGRNGSALSAAKGTLEPDKGKNAF